MVTMEKENTWLVEDLVGCEVVTIEGELLGHFTSVIKTGGNDVFMIGQGLSEILIPALKDVVLRVDLEAKRITVKLPAGLR